MTDNKCTAIIKTGERCSRNAVKDNLCTQHLKMLQELPKILQELPEDITENILSDYIEYEELEELKNTISGFKIKENRVVEKKYNDYGIDVVEFYVDGDLRNKKGYMNNILLYELNYKNGKKDGVSLFWNRDGSKSNELNYKNGIQDGVELYWWENKKGYMNNILLYKLNYKNGKKDGVSLSWNRDGSKSNELNYKNGIQDGVQLYWWENKNKLFSKENYKDGKKDGVQIYYNPDGIETKKENYRNGVLQKN
jgi:antitoxin component YwqK of YwqJK toxin-antitoxin module